MSPFNMWRFYLLSGVLFLSPLWQVQSAVHLQPIPRGETQELSREIRSLAAAKEAQVQRIGRKLGLASSQRIWDFFEAAKQGNQKKALALFAKLWGKAGIYEGFDKADPAVATPAWHAVLETGLAVRAYAGCGPRYSKAFASDIIASIPAGSLYFGGSEPGRGLVAAYCPSHDRGEPRFIISQNHLIDPWYRDYLRDIYGESLQIPTEADATRAGSDYFQDAKDRSQHGRLRPDEEVTTVDGKFQFRGYGAAMAINALLAKMVFENNASRECFVEEDYALDWMHPYLVPHGLIMKLERDPPAKIRPAVVKKDQDYWTARLQEMLGGWLERDTTVDTVCEFTTALYLQKDFSHFRGDREFVLKPYVRSAYARCRSAIAELYARRARQAGEAGERVRMQEEADFAFRQALAMDPANVEIVHRFATLLFEEEKYRDGLRVVRTAARLDPKNRWLKETAQHLETQVGQGTAWDR